MTPEPYLIELHGGCFDGCRTAVRYVPPHPRLELPVSPSSLAAPPSSSRAVVYQLKQILLTQVDGLPTLVYRYDYRGTRVRILRSLWEKAIRLIVPDAPATLGPLRDPRQPQNAPARGAL